MKTVKDMRIVIIGSGNVAEALALRLSGRGLVQIFARNRERGRKVAEMAHTGWSDNLLAEADAYLISVTDSAIREVAASLNFPKGAVVAHTAGSGTLEMLPESIGLRAIVYPFMTFSAGKKVDFESVHLFLEASSEEAMRRAEELASLLSPLVHHADGGRRGYLHIAGVFASNFANDMFAAAGEILAEAGIPFDVVSPLIAETAQKAASSGNPVLVQTGPAARNDRETIRRHLEILAGNKDLRDIYEKITDDICKRRISRNS